MNMQEGGLRAVHSDWVRDLLGIWMSSDVETVRHELGLPSVSPMFKHLGGPEDDDGSYSSAEVAAMKRAVDRLHDEHPDEWPEVRLACSRPWSTTSLRRCRRARCAGSKVAADLHGLAAA